MKISRKPTLPRPTAPSRPSRLVTADTAVARVSRLAASREQNNCVGSLPGGRTMPSDLELAVSRWQVGPKPAPIHPPWGMRRLRSF